MRDVAETSSGLAGRESIGIEPESPSTPSNQNRKRALLFASVALVAGSLLGTALTAAGVAEFAIGVRFTQEDLDDATSKAEKRGYDSGDKAGYDRGDKAGYDRGYDSGYSFGETTGYSSGKRDGCNGVFDKIGENLIAIRYPWYKSSVYGYYWPRSSIC